MIQCIGIGGEPGTGKSSLMRALCAKLKGMPFFVGAGKVRWAEYMGSRTAVLGAYGDAAMGSAYEGTDKLAMDVQPQVLEMLSSWNADPNRKAWTMLFEGDRLFNPKFLQSAFGILTPQRARFVLLQTPAWERDRRLAERPHRPDPSWMKGRITKYQGIAGVFSVEQWWNVQPEDQAKHVATLSRWIEDFQKAALQSA